MRLENAISDLALIQTRLQASEKVTCFRWLTTLIGGLIGSLAAWIQHWWVPHPVQQPMSYLIYWSSIAALVGSVSAVEIVYRYHHRSTDMRRRQTREALLDFAPSVVVSAVLSYFLVAAQPAYAQLLPSIWMLCFSLGLLNLRRKLPTATLYVAAYFFVASIVAIRLIDSTYSMSGWVMGVSFGPGQMLLAAVLFFGVKESSHGA